MITITNLSMSFGSKLLFDGVALALTKNKRYGIVGANGTGKTTFLNLLMGKEEPALGEIHIQKDLKIGWLKQDQFKYENEKVVNIVIRGKEQLWDLIHEKETLLESGEWNDEIGYRLGDIEEEIARLDGYTAEAFAQTLLQGLGIPEKYHFEPLSKLSGGYKLRVLLAQALFNKPDILLLDEPTNHLDIVTIAWLEKYLKRQFQGTVIFISHDQEFLDNLSTHILDFDYGDITQYTGNYAKFEKLKKLTAAQKLQERKQLEAKIAHLQTFVDRFKAKATKARQAKSKEKMIGRIEVPDIINSSRKEPSFHFQQKRPSGKRVLEVQDLSKKFEERTLFKNLNFTIQRGEKIVIIGENGVGKSTLLKCLLGMVEPDTGVYEWGYEAQIAYFSQDHHEELNQDVSMLEWGREKLSQFTDLEIRGMFGKMMFSGDDADKSVLSLSGGESARLLLGRIMLNKPNILILDEPTNHLDLEAIVTLGKKLKQFEGTVIGVSHNRHFIHAMANRIIAITHHKVIDHRGNFTSYLAKYEDEFLLPG